MAGSLVCKTCATSHGIDERFCPTCGMPLVYAPGVADGGKPVTDLHERARKVSPQYGEGELVKVGWARNQAEAELIAGLLLEEGIPSLVRRAGGFDVPDFLAAGPRDILVAASGADAARDVLQTVEHEVVSSAAGSPALQRRVVSVRGVAAAMLVVVAVSVAFAIFLAIVL